MDLTIAVCTYNRPQRLKALLEDLSGQTTDKNLFKVLVVDNASCDTTKKVFEEFLGRLSVSYARQPKLGLSHARNMGMEIADTPYIAYLDDDVRLDKDWVSKALSVIERLSPDIFGGPVFPYYDAPKPAWFLDKYATFGYWGDSTHPLVKDEYLSGNNIVFKKTLLEKLGGFNPRLGMRGYSLGYHEEAEVVKKALEQIQDVNILYVPEISLHHLVPSQKMLLRWHIRRSYCIAKSNIILYKKEILGNKISYFSLFKDICRQMVAIFFKSTFSAVLRDRKVYKHYKTYFMEKIMYNLDSLFNCLQIIFFGMTSVAKRRHAKSKLSIKFPIFFIAIFSIFYLILFYSASHVTMFGINKLRLLNRTDYESAEFYTIFKHKEEEALSFLSRISVKNNHTIEEAIALKYRLLFLSIPEFKEVTYKSIKSNLYLLECLKNGKNLSCGEFSQIYAFLLKALGFKIRIIQLSKYIFVSPNTHMVLELFDEERNKWILFDPTYNVYFVANGSFISMRELCDMVYLQDVKDIKILPENHPLFNLRQYFSFLNVVFIYRTFGEDGRRNLSMYPPFRYFSKVYSNHILDNHGYTLNKSVVFMQNTFAAFMYLVFPLGIMIFAGFVFVKFVKKGG